MTSPGNETVMLPAKITNSDADSGAASFESQIPAVPARMQFTYLKSFQELEGRQPQATEAGMPSLRNSIPRQNTFIPPETLPPNASAALAASATPLAHAISSVPEPTRVRVTHRWTGVVIELGDEWFVGRLQSLNGEGEELVADFTTDEVSEDDMNLLAEGAWFYVSVATKIFPDGRRSTESSLRFRRLPKWRGDELKIARERAQKMASLLDIDAE